jgi:hypothetical protein
LKKFSFDPEFCFKSYYIQSFLEQKQQNESFRSSVGLTLLAKIGCGMAKIRVQRGYDLGAA